MCLRIRLTNIGSIDNTTQNMIDMSASADENELSDGIRPDLSHHTRGIPERRRSSFRDRLIRSNATIIFLPKIHVARPQLPHMTSHHFPSVPMLSMAKF